MSLGKNHLIATVRSCFDAELVPLGKSKRSELRLLLVKLSAPNIVLSNEVATRAVRKLWHSIRILTTKTCVGQLVNIRARIASTLGTQFDQKRKWPTSLLGTARCAVKMQRGLSCRKETRSQVY